MPIREEYLWSENDAHPVLLCSSPSRWRWSLPRAQCCPFLWLRAAEQPAAAFRRCRKNRVVTCITMGFSYAPLFVTCVVFVLSFHFVVSFNEAILERCIL